MVISLYVHSCLVNVRDVYTELGTCSPVQTAEPYSLIALISD